MTGKWAKLVHTLEAKAPKRAKGSKGGRAAAHAGVEGNAAADGDARARAAPQEAGGGGNGGEGGIDGDSSLAAVAMRYHVFLTI